MNLTNEMKRLHEEVSELHRARGSFMSKLKGNVAQMRTDTRQRIAEIHQGQTRAACEAQQQRAGFISGLKNTVSQMMGESHGAMAQMAEKGHQDRAAFMGSLRSTVSQKLEEDHRTRAQMAKQGHQDRATFLGSVRSEVDDLKAGTRSFLRACQQDHAEATSQDQQRRTGFLSGMMQKCGETRRQLREDLAGARMAWAGKSERVHAEPADSDQPTTKTKNTPQRSGEAAPQERADVLEETRPDDLTIIVGIGEGMQKRLNEIGIYSLSGLANTRPELLQELLGKFGRVADVGSWITQARDHLNGK